MKNRLLKYFVYGCFLKDNIDKKINYEVAVKLATESTISLMCDIDKNKG